MPGHVGPDATAPGVERVAHDRIPEVVAFLERAHRQTDASAELFAGERGLARWRWLYEECPLPLPGGLPAWVCRDGGGIVGHCGALPVDAVIDGGVHRVAWARDLIVDPRARGKGIGSTLMTAVMRAVGHPMILGEYENAYPLYLRLGYADRGRLPLYVKVVRPKEFVAAAGVPRAARRLGAAVIPVLQARPPSRRATGPIEHLERFDERFDELWHRIEGALGRVIRRTSESMNWRYVANSHRYRLLAASSGGRQRGLAVIRTRTSRGIRSGTLVELLADPADTGTLLELIHAAETDLRSEDAVFIRAAVRHPAFGAALVRSGYLPVPSRIRWVAATIDGSSGERGLIDGKGWYLNGGDSDVDLL